MTRRQTIATERAPRAIGPYVQAVQVGEWIFVSGQIPLDPETGELVPGGIREQTDRVLQNIRAILEAAGSSLDQVVKATVYLTDLNDFSEMNEVYARYFPGEKPARATVQVSRLPRDARIEMDVIALR